MKNKTLSLTNVSYMQAVAFFALFGVSVLAPLAGAQIITGVLVNASLFLATIFFGVRGGILMGIFPSTVALFAGILPTFMAPFIPFIILGNILLVMVFGRLKESFWQGVFVSSFVKFVFLFSVFYLFTLVLTENNQVNLIAGTMGVTQFITAVLGGVFAYFVTKK